MKHRLLVTIASVLGAGIFLAAQDTRPLRPSGSAAAQVLGG